jgi:hypothetical protein
VSLAVSLLDHVGQLMSYQVAIGDGFAAGEEDIRTMSEGAGVEDTSSSRRARISVYPYATEVLTEERLNVIPERLRQRPTTITAVVDVRFDRRGNPGCTTPSTHLGSGSNRGLRIHHVPGHLISLSLILVVRPTHP